MVVFGTFRGLVDLRGKSTENAKPRPVAGSWQKANETR